LKVITLDPVMEEDLAKAFNGNTTAGVFGMQPAFVRRVLEGLRRLIGEQVAIATPILLCSTPARFHLRRILEPFLPKLVVLSPPEIPPMIPVQSVGTVQ
jgi:flagellar biosynthesis protein FlhA